MPREHRRARRALGVALTVVLALAGGIALLAFFVARDEAPVESERPPGVRGPGELADPGPHLPDARRAELMPALRAGNVVLVYGTPAPPPELAALARDVTGGPPDPALESAGQAVILARRAGTRGVVALAWQRRLRAGSPGDPQLRRFAEFWLGRGAGG